MILAVQCNIIGLRMLESDYNQKIITSKAVILEMFIFFWGGGKKYAGVECAYSKHSGIHSMNNLSIKDMKYL